MSEIKRKLATIQSIDKVIPIEGADNIVKITFKNIGWSCVTNKNSNPYEGKQVVYLEVDSVLPLTNSAFAFMEPYHYRVKTIKLRGQVSQGLTLPLSDFVGMLTNFDLEEGYDLTDALGIIKYEAPEPGQPGMCKGSFPGFIIKTDEERAQNLGNKTIERLLAEHEFDATVKMDGTSVTFYINGITDDPTSGEFGVCSRNQELKNTEGNVYWGMARKYNIEERLRGLGRNLAIQGEVAGPGIQANRAKLKEVQLFVFTVQDIDKTTRFSNDEIERILTTMNEFADGEELKMVPRLAVPTLATLDDIATLAEGTCVVSDSIREGVVLRAKDDASISFKFINPKYLLKHDL